MVDQEQRISPFTLVMLVGAIIVTIRLLSTVLR